MKVDLDNGALVAQTDNVSGAPMQFKLTNLGGWQSGAPLRTSVEDLPQGDGALPPSKSYRSARALSLEGVVYGGTAEEAEELAWDRIAGLSPMGQSMRLAVTTAVGERWMRVWLSSAPQVLPFGPNRARFQVPLVAPDPRKYSETKQYPAKLAGGSADGLHFPLGGAVGAPYLDFGTYAPAGTVTITNGGTAESWPTFTAIGSIGSGGFSVLSGADSLVFQDAVPLGAQRVLSPYTGGRVSDGAGVDYTDKLVQASWPSVKPGQTRTYAFSAFSPDSNAMVIVEFSEANW